MRIPESEIAGGRPTLSPNSMRTYGAGGFRLSEQEEARGCPRLYRAQYEEHTVKQGFSYPLVYGSMAHDALQLMEEEGLPPEDVLDRVVPATLEPEAYTEALGDLTAYLERGASPSDRFAALATEIELGAELYVDPDHGPIWIRGFIDWLGVDPNDPGTLHVVDYKSNRTPPSIDDVRGDVQLKAYHYLVQQNAERWGYGGQPRVVVHFDAIKYREVEVAFSDEDMDAWHAWAIAVARRILRDDEAKPRLNPGCSYCPIKGDCPAYERLPEISQSVMRLKPAGDAADDERLRWRDQADELRKILEKGVKEIDESFKQRALDHGEVVTPGGASFTRGPRWENVVDARSAHERLGDTLFYPLVKISKAALERTVKGWPASQRAPVDALVRREATGTTVTKKTS